MKLIVQVAVGYMYKVLKNNLRISMFSKEFAAIRHGDFFGFLEMIGKEIDYIVVYKNGNFNTETSIKESDFDAARLIKIGASLKQFYFDCKKEYGEIKDLDLTDEVFEKAALFELSLRMHLNNKRLTRERITLEKVINNTQTLMNLTDDETELFHKGRQFINWIKRPQKLKSTWNNANSDFKEAFALLGSKELTIL